MAKTGKSDKARIDLDEAIKLEPGHYDALFNLGLLWSKTREWGKAVPAFDRVLKLKPDHAGAYYARGVAEEHKGEQDRRCA